MVGRTGREAREREFDEFFRSSFPRAVALVRRVTGDQTRAEDAAVEALAKAHIHWGRLDPARRGSWVLKVAVNEALRRQHHADTVALDQHLGSDPAELIAVRETLVAALIALPPRQREVVVLRHLVGLSEADVASTLRLSIGTVKTHLRRALPRLRERLDALTREEAHAELA